MNKIAKISDFGQIKKLAFNRMMNITKMGKLIKPKKFMIIFTKI